jgi:hypothetical protein
MGDSPASLRYARLLQGWLGRFQWQHFLAEMRDSPLAPAIIASHEEGSTAKNRCSTPRGSLLSAGVNDRLSKLCLPYRGI